MDTLSGGLRASFVYFTAFRVAMNIRSSQKRERRLRILHDLPLDDEFQTHSSVEDLWEETHEINAKLIADSVVKLKGLWIKVGQFLSSRPDIMPMSYIRHFRKLQDSLPCRPWEEIDATLTDALGTEYEAQYFSNIKKEPMSCASIAQVHQGMLKTGEKVVLKVRHHNVENLMRNDLKNLESLCNWIVWWAPKYDFRKIVAEWIPAVQEELDLRNEARNLEQVRQNMICQKIKVIIPRIPDANLVKESVLVMEYCKGFSVRETSQYKSHGVDKLKLLERICTSWATQMHIDGIFNADPHPGNILVSTDEKMNGDDPSVPILLDFGLTRRFNDEIRVAFSRLVHSCYVMNIDEMLKSFEEMGLVIPQQDPFQDIYSLRSAFQTRPASIAKSVRDENRKKYQEKQKANPRTRDPVEAWPGELVFFTRVIGLLKGLCSMLEVQYPYLKLTATIARQTLLGTYAEKDHAKSLFYPESAASTALQDDIKSTLMEVDSKGELLGLQVAAFHNGECVVDIAAGKLSMTDPRPVQPDTLFNVFSVTKGLTSLLLHMAIQRQFGSYDDLVSSSWNGFDANGKESCTIRHVLNHQAGLANAFPENATVERLLDWNENLNFLKDAKPDSKPGENQNYHYLTFGYLVGGILEQITGKSFKELVTEWIEKPLDLAEEIYVGLPKEVPSSRLAVVHNAFAADVEDGLLHSFGSDQNSNEVDTRWERFKGREHLYNPTTFNMRQVREACMPSANGHMSARAVAKFYSTMTQNEGGGLVNIDDIIKAFDNEVTERITANDVFMSQSGDVTIQLGFRVYTFVRISDNKLVYGLGHPGLGGSFGMVIPEENFSLGLATSYLKADRKLESIIVGHVCNALKLKPVSESFLV
eukprot:g6826.t1